MGSAEEGRSAGSGGRIPIAPGRVAATVEKPGHPVSDVEAAPSDRSPESGRENLLATQTPALVTGIAIDARDRPACNAA